jgi:hypothetical protein
LCIPSVPAIQVPVEVEKIVFEERIVEVPVER